METVAPNSKFVGHFTESNSKNKSTFKTPVQRILLVRTDTLCNIKQQGKKPGHSWLIGPTELKLIFDSRGSVLYTTVKALAIY